MALACSKAPEGAAPWTLRLLASTMVEMEVVDGLSHETVRRALKKRAQALAQGDAVRAARGRRGVRGRSAF